MKDGNVEIIQFSPVGKIRGWKKWMGLIGIDKDGRIFMSPRVGGMGDMEAFLCAGFDSTPITVWDKNTLLVPADWLMKEKPKAREIIEKMIERIKVERPNAEAQKL